MNDFDGLIIGQNMTEERISEFKDMTIGNSKTKSKEKKMEENPEYPKTVGQLQKIYMECKYQKEKKEKRINI